MNYQQQKISRFLLVVMSFMIPVLVSLVIAIYRQVCSYCTYSINLMVYIIIILLAIVVSTVVTAVLVSVISVIVTSIVGYLLYWKKNKSYPQHKATDHVIYDTPDCINNNNTEMMECNVAYGVVKK